MKKLQYNNKEKKRASTLLSLGLGEFEAADILVKNEMYREAVIHMYFACFYISQALLIPHLIKKRPSHRSVESLLHKIYGKNADFPRRYLKLHIFLHSLRNELSYKETYIPNPRTVSSKLQVLQFYIKYAFRIAPKVEIIDLLHSIYEENSSDIKDFSYDVYCPKTYFHHTRITFWQPPFYLHYFSIEKLINQMKMLLSNLKIKNKNNYVIGLNSKLDQYRPVHLIMLDIDTLDSEVESSLKEIGGILLKTGRGFHFIGKDLIFGQKNWEKQLRKIKKNKILKNHVDKKHIEISLNRGYSTLRLTSCPAKPRNPIFYKEL